jgi:hypothetical protein
MTTMLGDRPDVQPVLHLLSASHELLDQKLEKPCTCWSTLCKGEYGVISCCATIEQQFYDRRLVRLYMHTYIQLGFVQFALAAVHLAASAVETLLNVALKHTAPAGTTW